MVTPVQDCAPHSNQVITGGFFVKHLRIIFCVTNILITLRLIPFLPLVIFCYVIATLFVSKCPFHSLLIYQVFFCCVPCAGCCSFDGSEAELCKSIFVKGSQTDALCPHWRLCVSLCKPCVYCLKNVEKKSVHNATQLRPYI